MTILDSPALPIILQHPSITNEQQLVCALLRTSKAMCRAISVHCAGLVVVNYLQLPSLGTMRWTPPQPTPSELHKDSWFLEWLSHHAHLAKSLKIMSLTLQLISGQENAIPAALAAAAAATPTATKVLQLQSFAAAVPIGAAGPILQHVHSGHLTELQLSLCVCQVHDVGTVLHAGHSLPALTALKRLHLSTNWHLAGLDPLLTALSTLSVLTHLHISPMSNLAALQLLRQQQLLELNVDFLGSAPSRVGKQEQLQLGQLTALTALHYCCRVADDAQQQRRWLFQAGDVLPPQLQLLHAEGCASFEPLSQLQQLEVLHLRHCSIPAQQLLQLSRLRELQLSGAAFTDLGAAPAAARSLQQLSLSNCRMPAAVVVQLGLLQSLTSLVWKQDGHSEGGLVQATAAQVAGSLRQLTALQQLEVRDIELEVPEDLRARGIRFDVAGSKAINKAIGGLPQLRNLALRLVEVDVEGAAVLLKRATQLTELVLEDVGLGDFSLGVLARSLTRLRRLDLSDNEHVTAASLPVVAQLLAHGQLTGLTTVGIGIRARKQELLAEHAVGVSWETGCDDDW